MSDQIQRERKVDLSKFSSEEAARIMEEVGAKAAELINKTKDEINTLLNIYGYEATFTVNFHDKKAQPKKGRSKKA